MDVEDFFENLWTKAESLASAAQPIEAEIAAAIQAAGGIASALAPTFAPEITAVTALVPAAVSDVTAIVAGGRQTISNVAPAASDLAARIAALYHMTQTPTGMLLTAKTTTATIPAAPGAAVS